MDNAILLGAQVLETDLEHIIALIAIIMVTGGCFFVLRMMYGYGKAVTGIVSQLQISNEQMAQSTKMNTELIKNQSSLVQSSMLQANSLEVLTRSIQQQENNLSKVTDTLEKLWETIKSNHAARISETRLMVEQASNQTSKRFDELSTAISQTSLVISSMLPAINDLQGGIKDTQTAVDSFRKPLDDLSTHASRTREQLERFEGEINRTRTDSTTRGELVSKMMISLQEKLKTLQEEVAKLSIYKLQELDNGTMDSKPSEPPPVLGDSSGVSSSVGSDPEVTA